jgi:hypothetical protein
MSTSGVKNLKKVQLGRQTNNTAVAATTIWRGPAMTVKDDRVQVRPKEDVGVSSLTNRAYTPKLLGSIAFPSTEATFQQIQHFLEGGVKTVTPVADGVGTDFINSYPLPHIDQNTTKLYTIESGNNKIEEELDCAFLVDFTLTGKKNEAWMLTGNWQGRQCQVTSFTSALTAPAVSEMLFNRSKLFIDDVGGTIGSTQIANAFIAATIKITTGLKAQFTGDGELYFTFVDFIGAKASLELTLLHNATTAAERVKWRANTPRQIRILCEGNAFGTPGTTYSRETFKCDMAGLYTQFGEPNEEDEGSDAMKVVFDGGYDSTAALFCNLLLANELSAVP